MKFCLPIIFVAFTLSCVTFASSVQPEYTSCETTKLSRLEFIQTISLSEELAKLQGPHRDVTIIEVFAVSENGRSAKVNLTFSGSVGNSETVTLNANINCNAGGILELE